MKEPYVFIVLFVEILSFIRLNCNDRTVENHTSFLTLVELPKKR